MAKVQSGFGAGKHFIDCENTEFASNDQHYCFPKCLDRALDAAYYDVLSCNVHSVCVIVCEMLIWGAVG